MQNTWIPNRVQFRKVRKHVTKLAANYGIYLPKITRCIISTKQLVTALTKKSRRILLWWTLYMFPNYSVKLRLLHIEARHENHSKKNKIAQIRTAIKGIHISLYTWKLTDRDAWQSLSKKIKWSLLFDLIMPGQSQWDVAA